MESAERREIERLADEVAGLNEGLPPDHASVEGGTVVYRFRAYRSTVERDEKGLISRVVGPDGIRTVERDDQGYVTGWRTEEEEIRPE